MKQNRYNWYYLLGFGFLDYQNAEKGMILTKDSRLSKVVEDIALCFNQEITSSRWTVSLLITDDDLVVFLKKYGVLTPKRYMPSIDDEYASAFIAGYFDAYGEFSFKYDNPRLFVSSSIGGVIDFISKHWKANTLYVDKVVVNGYKALDVCGAMYKNITIRHSKFYAFFDVLNFASDRTQLSKKKFECMKLHPNALEPVKSRVTDSGYDLHVVELNKLYAAPGGMVVYQGKTNLAIKPILGYAFDVNGRSSLPKNGWMFMQGTGIADKSYVGGIEGTFLRLNEGLMPEMPWRALQIVPREAPIHADFEVKKSLGESDRNVGGFGSTGY